jgi:hypothetical protein
MFDADKMTYRNHDAHMQADLWEAFLNRLQRQACISLSF